MNILDKIIAPFSPAWALARGTARVKLSSLEEIQNLGYSRHGASRSKKSLAGWFSQGGSPTEDIVKNLPLLRERSRDLYMGVPIATGALKTIRTNVIGSGLKLNASIDAAFLGLSDDEAREWERHVEREFSLWTDTQDCDAARQCTFGQLQALTVLSALMNGDIFASLPVVKRQGAVYDLRVSLIESDKVCNPTDRILPNVYGGIEVGDFGEPLAYWIAKHHPGSTEVLKRIWRRVPAFGAKTGRRNILHILQDFERPGQNRGVPVLAPVIESLKQLGRYTDAELVAAVVAGMFTVFIKSESPDTPVGEAGIPHDELTDRADENSLEMAPGGVVGLAEGESVETADPGRPNTAFDGFVTAICRQIGAALELPYELLIKHFTASYSASRAALLEAWKMFRMRREWMIQTFCQPIYEEWLSEAIAKGRVYAPGFFYAPEVRAAWCGAQWYGPSQGQLDPLKEVKAAKIRVDEDFSTRERETAELTGANFENAIPIRAREEQQRRKNGLKNSQPCPTEIETTDSEEQPDA